MTFILKILLTRYSNAERPSPPENITFNYIGDSSSVNISWTATAIPGVEQNYTIFFDTHIVETTQHYYIFRQNTTDSNITCVAFIRTMNGAGESDPSDIINIPSLPDIGPVSASLTNQVWKSGKVLMVSVSFEVSDCNCHEKNIIQFHSVGAASIIL